MTVILVAHIMVAIALIIVVLMQRSEGGALGIGGGGGGAGGGLMSGRGVAGALVRTTVILGGIFFITSVGLVVFASRNADNLSEVERRALEQEAEDAERDTGGDILDIGPLDESGSSLVRDPLAGDPLDPLLPGPDDSSGDSSDGSSQPVPTSDPASGGSETEPATDTQSDTSERP